jgi:DNA (cytosine-5)-methyltransferase 1
VGEPVAAMILSIFPGIDLLGRAFEEVWPEACVVRGPDRLWGGDIVRFHPPAGVFDGVIGGPPCQAHSRLRLLVSHNGYAIARDHIPDFERIVREAKPAWFLMEMVPGGPRPAVEGYDAVSVTVRDVHLGGETQRRRTLTFGRRDGPARLALEYAALHRPDPAAPVLASGGRPVPDALGGSGPVTRTRRAIETRKGAAAWGFKTERYLVKALGDSGLPADFLADAPFTVAGKIHVIGNGVPMAMGRAIARAVKEAVRHA